MIALGLSANQIEAQSIAQAQQINPSAIPGSSTASQVPSATSSESPKQLTAVTVTATKRKESVEKIPASIVAITGDELEQRGAQNLGDIIKLVPGVNLVTPAGNAARITIRGIAGEANTNPTTGILFGDVSFMDAYVPHVTLDPNPFDLENVEVLKGPQGTLFGASALNGAIRYVPMQPEFDQVNGKYYAEYGSVSGGSHANSFGMMLNIPMNRSNTIALRLVAYHSDLPGWIDNTRTQKKYSNMGDQTGVRGILAWHPNDDLNVSLTVAGQQTKFDDVPDADNADGDLKASNRPRPSPSNTNYDLASLSVNYNAGAFNFVSETGYVRKAYRDFGENSYSVIPGGALPLLSFKFNDKSTSLSQEFRLVSNDNADSPWSWVAGVFASRQNISQQDVIGLGDPSVPALETVDGLNNVLPGLGYAWYGLGQPDYNDANIHVSVKEVAAFFDVTRKFADDWELALGGRLYRTSSGGSVNNEGLLEAISGSPNGRFIDDTIRDDGFSPKASLTWHITDDAMVYTLASKGYRVGGVQWGLSGLFAERPAPNLFKTDSIWNYELGTRTKWFDNTLAFDATAFYEIWKNPQVLVLDPSGLGSYIDNVGKVKSKGAETSLKYLFKGVPGLSVTAAATYTDAKTTVPFVTANNQIIASGTQWPLSPRWQTAGTIDYQHGVGSGYFGASLSQSYLSRTTYGIDQPDTVFGYHEWDGQIRLGSSTLPTQPELSLTVNNIFNKRGITTAYSGALYHEVTYIQPRTVMLRLSGSF